MRLHRLSSTPLLSQCGRNVLCRNSSSLPSHGRLDISSLGNMEEIEISNDIGVGIKTPVKTALVVGGGVAGLATAACLGRVGIRVTVALGGDRGRDESKRTDPGIGIWTHGLDCLDKLGVLKELEADGRYMGAAGYKSPTGKWLARPSKPLGEFRSSKEMKANPGNDRGDTSVLFVRESRLLNALRSCLASNTEIVHKDIDDLRRWDDVKHGDSLSIRTTAAGAATISGDSPNSWSGPFDLVVGADGPSSFVRRRTLIDALAEASVDEAASKVALAASPQSRGYIVYRGVCKGERAPDSSAAAAVAGAKADRSPGGWGLESFQTWGPGLRFASVPLAGDERMWFATTADVNSSSKQSSSQPPPPPSPSQKKPFLLEKFQGWHDPIADLLNATDEEDISRENAYAMTPSALKLVAEISAVGTGSGYKPLGGRIVLVGDAAHTLDPVLAQGAGVALEDAFVLAWHLAEFNKSVSQASSSASSSPGSAQIDRETSTLEVTLKDYAQERLQRALLLSRLSDLSQGLGQLRPSGLISLRDSIMGVTPNRLKSRFFDGFLGATLAGGSNRAMSAAAMSAGFRTGGRLYGGFRMPDLRHRKH